MKALDYELSLLRYKEEEDLLRFFKGIGYHTEIQPGYIYTNINDGHGLHTLRRGIIRASNRPERND